MKIRPISSLLVVVLGVVLLLGVCRQVDGQCANGVCEQPQPQWQVTTPSISPIKGSPEYEFIGRVICPDADGVGMGTGTVIDRDDKYSYIITAAHVIRGSDRIEFSPSSGSPAKCNILKSDPVNDWAVLRCKRLAIRPAKSVFTDDVKISVGDPVTAYGYVQGQRFASSNGTVRQFVSGDEGRTWNMVETSCAASDGMSGGPLVSRDYVVGTVTGGAYGYCSGPCFPRLRAAIRAVLPPYPNRPGVIIPRRPLVPVRPPPPAATQPNIPRPPGNTAPTEACPGLADVRERLTVLEAAVAEFKATPGPVGDKGPAGDKGPPGDPGDLSMIIARIETLEATLAVLQNPPPLDLSQLPPIKIQTLDFSGNVYQEATARLGDAVRLKPIPIGKESE